MRVRVTERATVCDECDNHRERLVVFRMFGTEVCAECIRIAGIILARAEKDAAKDQVPSPEGERK